MAKKAAPKKATPAPILGGSQQPGAVAGSHRNPPPDPRMHTPTPWVGQVERGFIQEHMPPGPGEVYFLYNPNSLGYTFSFNESLSDPSQTAQIPTMGALGGTVLGFEILFNRQYEVAYGGSSQGVMADIDALKYIVGMKDPSFNYMLLKTLKFTLGKNLVFYGYINQMSATIEFFSEKMVPMMARVGISATQMPEAFNPQGLFGGSGGVTPMSSGNVPQNIAGRPTVAGPVVSNRAILAPGGTRSGNQP